MLNTSPMQTAARHRRRLETLTAQGHEPCCYRCGFDNVAALEIHHVANRANDEDLTVVTCRNCHRVLTELNAAAGVPTRYDETPTDLDRLAALLASAGVVLTDLGSTLERYSHVVDRLSAPRGGVVGSLR